MATVGKSTRIIHKAQTHMMAALDRAKGSLADIPMGVEKLDPRTEKKRAEEMPPGLDTTLTRLTYEMSNNNTEGQQ